MAQVNAGAFRTKPKEAMHRIFQDYYEGEQAGYKPKDKRIGYQLIAAERSIRMAIEAKKALKALMESKEADGLPTVVIGGASNFVPKEEVEGKEAYFIKPNAIKGMDWRKYKYLDHPALRKWKWVDKDPDGKPIFVQGPMFIHKDSFGRLNAILGRSKIRTWKIPEKIPVIGGSQPGRAALNVGAFIKGSILIGPFHQMHVGEHAVFHTVNPFGPPEIDFEKRPVLKEGVEHGLMLVSHNAMQEFSEGLATGGLWHRIPGIGPQLLRYQEWLFTDYIPRLKAAMYEHAVERALKYYDKDLKSGKLTRDQLLENAAKQANAAFGEQNYKYIGRNPTLQDSLRIGLLAPDFLEARFRFWGQAMRPYGKEQVRALLIGAIVMGVSAQIINAIIGDDKKFHWDRPFSVFIGGKEYTPRSVVGDMAHLIQDPRGFWYHRLNPLWGRPLVEISTGRDFYGKKVGTLEAAKDILKSWTPIPGQGITRTPNGETTLRRITDGLFSSVGLSNWRYRTDFQRYAEQIDKGTFPSTEKSKIKHELIMELQVENPDANKNISKAIREKTITMKDAIHIKKEGATNPSARIAGKLTIDEITDGIRYMTKEEKDLIYPIFIKKIISTLKTGALDIEDAEIKKEYRDAIKKFKE